MEGNKLTLSKEGNNIKIRIINNNIIKQPTYITISPDSIKAKKYISKTIDNDINKAVSTAITLALADASLAKIIESKLLYFKILIF